LGSFGADKERFTVGIVTLSAAKSVKEIKSIIKKAFFILILPLENILDYNKSPLK